MARVLIIEDEPEISMILEEVLKEEGDEVTPFQTASVD